MERENIKDLLKLDKLVIAEIGVEYGGFTDKYFDDIHEIHLIDMWQTEGNDYYFSKREGQVEKGYDIIINKYKNKQNITIVKMKSSDASLLYKDDYFDWIYIDADHSYEGVKEDIIKWYPKLKKGGIISGHDFDPSEDDPNCNLYGVKKAVEEIFGDKYKLTNEKNYKSWYVYK